MRFENLNSDIEMWRSLVTLRREVSIEWVRANLMGLTEER